MKLYSGETYWDKTMKSDSSFPKLDSNIKTEILIVGGGMSGSLAAYVLAKSNHQVTLIEKNKVANGSSSANTGLLQYSSDIMMHELADSIGEKHGVLFYKMCLEAMNDLTDINKTLELETDYILRDSIYYASSESDAKKLEKEYKLLSKYDFPVEFLNNKDLNDSYGIDKPCALRTWQDAEVNPYKFIQSLTHENKKLGVKYFEHTSINLDDIKDSKVFTDDDFEIEFENIILATGYGKVYDVIKDKARIDRTYALASKPLKNSPWETDVMVWETMDPYLYFRTTTDHRVVAGGLDEHISVVETDTGKIQEKNCEILKEIQSIMPDLDIEIDYSWNALFGSSTDGIPFIGKDPFMKNKYYLLGYEGNGTCYSMSGANIIKDLIEGRDNKYSDIVKVNR